LFLFLLVGLHRDHHIGNPSEIPFDLILNRIRERMGFIHTHGWIDKEMKINVYAIRPTPYSCTLGASLKISGVEKDFLAE
jgi:hypothetical protein